MRCMQFLNDPKNICFSNIFSREFEQRGLQLLFVVKKRAL